MYWEGWAYNAGHGAQGALNTIAKMCGIIGYTGARQAVPLLLEGLRKLEYRGYDSAGVAVVDSTRAPATTSTRCEGKIVNLESRLELEAVTGTTGIGHTRWATHGAPSERNAHPHRAGRVSVVHNGIIENHAALRGRLTGAGRSLASDTDTELVAHLIDEAYERGKQEGEEEARLHLALRTAVQQLEGSFALCVVHDDHPQEIVVARRASPLLIGLAGPKHGEDSPADENFIASDVSAMLQHTRVVIDLDDGDTARVLPDTVELFDGDGAPVKRRTRRVDWSPLAAEKQGFKHFMLKEIHEQPRAIRDTLMGRLVSDESGAPHIDFGDLDLDLSEQTKITLLACGTSWHAALAGKYLIEQLARVPVEVDLASEYRYRSPIVRAQDIVIAISQSGETADTLAAMTEAMRLGATSVAISNVVDSTIPRRANHVLYTHAGPEISVASTKAFTTQLTMLTMLAIHLGRRTGSLEADRAHELIQGLRSLPVSIDLMLGLSAQLKTIARRYSTARDFLYLGRGLSFPVALEAALKLKEISYIHAEGYASGEMKHGPIALIDEHVPVVVLALRGPGYDKALSNLDQVRARGGRIIALASMGDTQIGDLADDVVLVPDVDEYLQPILASVPLQLLAYYTADLKGTDVDQPRNLAKSVTVE
jgi:glucosamine--fructose-6-phosphate aminotransferase (isomerizing)